MKLLLVAIDAKYIHTNLAVRYLKANCDFPVDICEFTIKNNLERMGRDIIDKNPDLVGFSVYIWNVEIVRKLTALIGRNHRCRIVWGGPEVSYDSESYFEHLPIDYIIRGEGELAFNQLVHALNGDMALEDVANLSYRKGSMVLSNPDRPIADLSRLHNPYFFPEFYSAIPNKFQYVESSRGCPFHCSYCLASLDNRVRFFPIELVKANIDFLVMKGARTIKFLDRTFNLRETRVLEILRHIVSLKTDNVSFQFEVNADILSTDLIDKINAFVPKGLIRFEIGIQSANEASNLAVKRIQDLEVLFNNIRRLQKADVVDLHLDLIAGLPEEDLDSFENTFNLALSCRAKELQLGFLKLLKGTSLRDEADKFGYEYHKTPPYEVYRNYWLSEKDILEIKMVEKMLNIYWNKGFMNNAIGFIVDNVASAFAFFRELARYYLNNHYDTGRYQLADVFERLNQFLTERYPEIQALSFSELKKDYLEYHSFRPKIWWDHRSIHKNSLLRQYFLMDQTFSLDSLYKYSVVTTYHDKYMIVLYLPDQRITRMVSFI